MEKFNTYFITGGAGFIGSHLTARALSEGKRVIALDNFSTGSIDNIDSFKSHPYYEFHEGSIHDLRLLKELSQSADIIFHLAAAVGVELIVNDPLNTIETNIRGTENVLHAATKNKTPVFIASTSEVYGKSEQFPFKEENDIVLGPSYLSRWSYAATKLVDEFLALAYSAQRELPVVIARFFNTIGPGQTGQYGMVVPRFIQQALAGESITVYGDGEQSRCFCHVSDVIEAVLRLINEPKAYGQVFNIGSQEEISINQLAERIISLTQQETQRQQRVKITHTPYEQAYRPGFEDTVRRVPDTSKVEQLVGWQPQYKLDRTIKDIIHSLVSAVAA